MGDGADLIQVLLLRLFHSDLPLGDQENILLPLHGPLQGRNGDGPLHVKGQIHMREDRQTAKSQHRHIDCSRFHRRHRVHAPFQALENNGTEWKMSLQPERKGRYSLPLFQSGAGPGVFLCQDADFGGRDFPLLPGFSFTE